MEFLPWKTINLDGGFRVTAPESVSEEILHEVSCVPARIKGVVLAAGGDPALYAPPFLVVKSFI